MKGATEDRSGFERLAGGEGERFFGGEGDRFFFESDRESLVPEVEPELLRERLEERERERRSR